MKKVWLVQERDDICNNIRLFQNMDDAHDYANVLLMQYRVQGYESDSEGICFSKEQLRKRNCQYITLYDDYKVEVSVERKDVK